MQVKMLKYLSSMLIKELYSMWLILQKLGLVKISNNEVLLSNQMLNKTVFANIFTGKQAWPMKDT